MRYDGRLENLRGQQRRDKIEELKLYAIENNANLQAENEQLKEQNRWIPVGEGLPKNIADVFILTNEGSGGVGMYGELDEGVYGWERLDYAINLNITHWKPIVLPPPAEKSGGCPQGKGDEDA